MPELQTPASETETLFKQALQLERFARINLDTAKINLRHAEKALDDASDATQSLRDQLELEGLNPAEIEEQIRRGA